MKERRFSAPTIAKFIIRTLVGVFFITAAVMKLVSIDNFEVYIYSFNLLSFNLSAVAARLVIAAELLLGSFLIAKILYKPTWWLSMLMMIGFTLFLGYAALFRHDTNCHCMGDIVQLSPAYSIIKNIVTIILLLLVRKEEDYHFRGKTAVGVVCAVLAFVVPFVLFPTDSLYNLFRKSGCAVDGRRFEQLMQDSAARSLDAGEGDYVFGFLSAGCKYCKIGSKKLNTMVEINRLDTNRVVFFIWGSEKSIRQFKEETGATHFRYVTLSPVEAIKIVDGIFPTYVLVKDGQPVEATDVRGLNDRKIRDFLSK